MLSLRIINGMNRQIAKRVSYLRHQCPLAEQPARRVALRCFSELVLGTINDLIAGMLKDGRSLHECNAKEKEFVKRLRLCARDIHAQLRSVNCDIGPDDEQENAK
ncbi:hypothetical protein [Escherichia coli]|uniref:hypothetical protein n=1 Tax=Escherichia coli TaxID=562 RepID=UPI0015D49F5D|nr:hypothetical protein [Escherichia coli]EER7558103.1 hypothetical protein [Escherichia coli]EJD4214356.1 hypothetical protein [Escherichia coli]HBB7044600.1 hypothetical protein [Escherichia coli]HDV2374288.1 hypothetical protein [Escherichia coli]